MPLAAKERGSILVNHFFRNILGNFGGKYFKIFFWSISGLPRPHLSLNLEKEEKAMMP